MSKATWINVGGTWRQVIKVFRNTGGIWNSGTIPLVGVDNYGITIWHECIDYSDILRTVNYAIQVADTTPDTGGYCSIILNGVSKVHLENPDSEDVIYGSFTCYIGDTIRCVAQCGTFGATDQNNLGETNGGATIYQETNIGYLNTIDHTITMGDYSDLNINLYVDGS